jgi:hypothetical protein
MTVAGRPADSSPAGDPVVARAGTLLAALTGFDGPRFDPAALIRAANYLHGLGFERALDILHQFGQPAAGPTQVEPDNVLLVARALFVPRSAQDTLPRLTLGLPDLAEPDDPTVAPLFPLHVHRDLPLLLVGGYAIGGEGLPPTEYLKQVGWLGSLRPAPLQPPDDPLASVDEFLASPRWRQLKGDDWHAGLLRGQALRAVATIISATEADERALFSAASALPVWSALRQRAAQRAPRWNPTTQVYEAGRS